MYKLFKDLTGTENVGVILDGKIAIPFAPANTDYKAYLAWVAEGNTPQPADEPTA
jgi:hypothetical protein